MFFKAGEMGWTQWSEIKNLIRKLYIYRLIKDLFHTSWICKVDLIYLEKIEIKSPINYQKCYKTPEKIMSNFLIGTFIDLFICWIFETCYFPNEIYKNCSLWETKLLLTRWNCFFCTLKSPIQNDESNVTWTVTR